jgi:hypothetical protein
MSSGIVSFDDFPAFLSAQKSLVRYNSVLEAKPDHDWYSLKKTEIDSQLKDLAQHIGDLLKGAPQGDKELQHLLRTSSELSHVSLSPAIKVALLGAQGAGKSLMINAIFDCDGLSLTGADGAACTSSITRYVAFPETQFGDNTKFYAEVKFLSAEQRGTLLQEHARSYYHYQNSDDDSDDEESSRPKARRQEEMDERLKDTAEDVFVTLFGSQEAFTDNWSASAYKSGEFVRLCQLKGEEALKKENVDSYGVAMKIGDNQKDLLQQLRPFLTKVKGVACLWPLVDSISIRLCHDVLQANIELIDLPGQYSCTVKDRY